MIVNRRIHFLFLISLQMVSLQQARSTTQLPPIEDQVVARFAEEFERNLRIIRGFNGFCQTTAQGQPQYLGPAKRLMERLRFEVQSARYALGIKEQPSFEEVQRQYFTFKRNWEPSVRSQLEKFMLPHEFEKLPLPAPGIYSDTVRLRVERARPILEAALQFQDLSYVLGSRMDAEDLGALSLLDAVERFLMRMPEASKLGQQQVFELKSLADAYRLSGAQSASMDTNSAIFLKFIEAFSLFLR